MLPERVPTWTVIPDKGKGDPLETEVTEKEACEEPQALNVKEAKNTNSVIPRALVNLKFFTIELSIF